VTLSVRGSTLGEPDYEAMGGPMARSNVRCPLGTTDRDARETSWLCIRIAGAVSGSPPVQQLMEPGIEKVFHFARAS